MICDCLHDFEIKANGGTILQGGRKIKFDKIWIANVLWNHAIYDCESRQLAFYNATESEPKLIYQF